MRLGSTSLARLDTCEVRIQLLIYRSAATWVGDFGVVCGHRSLAEQERLWQESQRPGAKVLTKKRPGESAHNSFPSRAVDIAPWHTTRREFDWDNDDAFVALRSHVDANASALGIKLKPAISWDMGHVELADG